MKHQSCQCRTRFLDWQSAIIAIWDAELAGGEQCRCGQESRRGKTAVSSSMGSTHVHIDQPRRAHRSAQVQSARAPARRRALSWRENCACSITVVCCTSCDRACRASCPLRAEPMFAYPAMRVCSRRLPQHGNAYAARCRLECLPGFCSHAMPEMWLVLGSSPRQVRPALARELPLHGPRRCAEHVRRDEPGSLRRVRKRGRVGPGACPVARIRRGLPRRRGM